MHDEIRSPRPFRMLAACVFAAGVALTVASWRAVPITFSVQLLLVATAAVLSENYALSLPKYTVSLSYPLTIAAVVLCGPTAAAIVAVLSATSIKEILSQKRLSVIAFNMGQLPLITLVGGYAYWVLSDHRLLMIGDTPAPLTPDDFPKILVALVVMSLICSLGNLVLTGLAISALRDEPFSGAFAGISWLIPTQITLAAVGILIGQVLSISPIAFPLFIAPLVIAQQLYQRYSFMKAAYADTVRSLVGALEAKDPYTRGHSERVAKYSMGIASHLGIEASRAERLEYAALLHDIGKIAVPLGILRKEGPLEASEREQIRAHAERGAAMVERIPPLRDLTEYIKQHHEFFSGGGYPDGLQGPEIHQFARILAVADSFDAMTTSRPYRPAMEIDIALEELARYSGTQFDPEVVRAFESPGDFDLPKLDEAVTSHRSSEQFIMGDV